MQFTQATLGVPSLEVVNGRPTTLSTQVAEYFGKNHQHVSRDIRNLIEKCPELGVSNFGQTTYKDSQGKSQPCYRMDRKGFVLLAMGFTGEKALQFKIAYIDEFDRMEEELRGQYSACAKNAHIETLTPAQQLAIQQAVGRRAQKTANHYQTIYRAIKLRYQIARYDQLPQSLFEDCLKFIETVDLHVPETAAPKQETVAIPVQPQTDVLTRVECERLLGLVYEFKYLHKKEIDAIYDLLKAVKSPLAPSFWELKESWSIGNLERILAAHGYRVKDLDCYKHLMGINA